MVGRTRYLLPLTLVAALMMALPVIGQEDEGTVTLMPVMDENTGPMVSLDGRMPTSAQCCAHWRASRAPTSWLRPESWARSP